MSDRYRVRVWFDYIVEAESEDDALEQAGEIDMPSTYIEDSFNADVKGVIPPNVDN